MTSDRPPGGHSPWDGTLVDPKPASSGRQVLVEAGGLQMVRNALRRDADEGRKARAEMLHELDAATESEPPGVLHRLKVHGAQHVVGADERIVCTPEQAALAILDVTGLDVEWVGAATADLPADKQTIPIGKVPAHQLLTGAALRRLFHSLEPLVGNEDEATIASWWKHLAGSIRVVIGASSQPQVDCDQCAEAGPHAERVRGEAPS